MSLHDHPTRIGVGTSLHRDPRRAGREAAEAALHQAGLDRADSAILFSTVGYPQERVLAAVSAALPGADVFGCSGEGIISQGLSNESNHAVGVMVWSSTRDRLRTASARGVLADSRAAGREVSAKLGRLPDDTVAVLVLADGLNINFDQLVAGMRENWGSLPIERHEKLTPWRHRKLTPLARRGAHGLRRGSPPGMRVTDPRPEGSNGRTRRRGGGAASERAWLGGAPHRSRAGHRSEHGAALHPPGRLAALPAAAA